MCNDKRSLNAHRLHINHTDYMSLFLYFIIYCYYFRNRLEVLVVSSKMIKLHILPNRTVISHIVTLILKHLTVHHFILVELVNGKVSFGSD